MKKTLLLFCFLIILKSTYAQTDRKRSDTYVTFSVGAGIQSIDNRAFDSWTQANYGKKYTNKVSGNIDLGAVHKNYDAGISFTGSSADFRTFTVYAGRKITSDKSPLVSFLNFGIGGLIITDRSLAPLNYVPSPDEIGKDMELKYNATYIGIYSKNYLNSLSFGIGKSKRVAVKPGFYLNFEYQVGGSSWEYGYTQDNGTSTYYNVDGTSYTTDDTKFIGKKIYNIPKLANKFLNVGFFIAITAF